MVPNPSSYSLAPSYTLLVLLRILLTLALLSPAFAQFVHTSGTQEPFGDDKPSVPVPGAPTFTGTIFTFGTRAVPGQKRQYGTVGDTYISVVDFGKRPDARSLLVMGESADPQSKHFFDQAPLYSTQQFKPAWFDLREIRTHLERSYHP